MPTLVAPLEQLGARVGRCLPLPPLHALAFAMGTHDDDDDVYYPKGRKPREDEEGEESYEKQRQRPGGRGLDARSCASTGRKDVVRG